MKARSFRRGGTVGLPARSALMRVTAPVCLWAFMSVAPLPAAPFSARTSEAVAAGNEAYQRGDFAAAEQDYRRALEAGANGSTVLYNLGNACFKQKKLGEAIYWWERAKRLDPDDPDIRENLEFARLLVVDRMEIPPDPFPVRVLRAATHQFSEKAESWTLVALFAAANGCFALWLFTDRRRLALAALFGIVVTLLASSLVGTSIAWKIVERKSTREGVVVEQKVEVRSGPSEENTVLFSLHEGIVVRIRSAAGPWLQVSLPNGWNGWLRADAVRQ